MSAIDRYEKIKAYLLGQQDPKDLETIQAEEELAQDARNVAGIGSGIDKIISAIGGTQANPEPYNQMQKLAGEGPSRVREYLKRKYELKKDAESRAMDIARSEQQAEQNDLTRQGVEEQRKFNQSIAQQNIDMKKSEIERDKAKEAMGTADERKASTHVSDLEQANKDLEDIRASGYKRESDKLATEREMLPEFAQAKLLEKGLVSPKASQFSQAERRFYNATLRRDSGASLSKTEKQEAIAQYFERPGDSPEAIAQKQKNRREKIEAMRREAGPLGKKQEGRSPDQKTTQKVIRVRQKSTGQTGSIPEDELTDEYERL